MPLSEPRTTALLSWRGNELNFKNLKTKQYPLKGISNSFYEVLIRNEAHVDG